MPALYLSDSDAVMGVEGDNRICPVARIRLGFRLPENTPVLSSHSAG